MLTTNLQLSFVDTLRCPMQIVIVVLALQSTPMLTLTTCRSMSLLLS